MFPENIQTTIPHFPIDDFENARMELSVHAKNPQKFSPKPTKIFVFSEETEIDEDFTGKSLRRYICVNVHFKNSKFIKSAVVGAQFLNCIFDNCVIDNSNFQHSNIKHFKIFSNDNMLANFSNFSDTSIIDFDIHHITFDNCIFNGTLFCRGKFRKVILSSGTFENAIFQDVIFENVVFSDLNIDYAEFNSIKMHDTTLPFSQIPYTFGLLDYLMSTEDNVYITSAANSNKRIAVKDYLSLLDSFVVYYANTDAFFPLANIYICTGRQQLAYTAIECGIQKALLDHDYRLLKYFCKLISRYSYFNYNQRQSLYYKINEFATITNGSYEDQFRFYLQKPLIEYYLLRNTYSHDIAILELLIQTDYDYSEVQKTNYIYQFLESEISSFESKMGSHKIEVSHHSSPAITLIFEDYSYLLLAIVPFIYAGLKGFIGLLNSYQDYVSKHEEYKYNKEIHNAQVQSAALDNELKRLVIEKEKYNILDLQKKQEIEEKTANLELKTKEVHKYIQKNDIQIKEIRHAIFCTDSNIQNSDLQKFTYYK